MANIHFADKIMLTIPIDEDSTPQDVEAEVNDFISNLRNRMLEELHDQAWKLF